MMLDKLSNRLSEHVIANERCYVQNRHHARRLAWHEGIIALVAFSAVIARAFVKDDTPLGLLVSIIIGLSVGSGLFMSTRRALAYRSGWIDGRGAMVRAMDEAQRRGMSPREWLVAELARDMSLYGVTVDPYEGCHDDD